MERATGTAFHRFHAIVMSVVQPTADREATRAPARRRRPRLWLRALWIAFVVPFVTAFLLIAGPLVFSIVVAVLYGIHRFLGRRRRLERRVDLRLRRMRSLERAIENGGPSDKPRTRYRSPSPGEAEKRLFRKQFTGQIRGGWPRGRV